MQKRDLVVLVADKDMEKTVLGLMGRSEALGIRPIQAIVYSHRGRDAGCRTSGAEFLRMFCNQFDHALLVFDREGSGRDERSAEDLEYALENELKKNGWQERAAALVLDPELEIWVWSDSREVDRIIGWSGRFPPLRDWLVEEGLLARPDAKPARPKEAFRRSLRHVRKQPSSALFGQLASKVSFRNCTDRAFLKFTAKLREWFPPPARDLV